MKPRDNPYAAAQAEFGFLRARKMLILRRLSQAFFLTLFLTGPLLGVWITKGTLASSLTLGVLPLTDPFVLLQSLFARHWPEFTAVLGAAILLAAYLLLGGRSYCAWVCPLNPVADLAAWLRRRLGLTQTAKLRPAFRNYLVVVALIVSAAASVVAWELVNPITALHRALVFGAWFGLFGAVAVFLFDLLTAKHGWCGHICPVGAFYGFVGKASLLRVSASGRDACDDCMDCFAICPEPQVISPALRGRDGAGPVIVSGDCTLCGACVDVCSKKVFRYGHRFERPDAAAPPASPPPAATKSQFAPLERIDP